jgi:TonB family protein
MIRVEPIYPEKVKKTGIEGISMVELYVNELGEVSSARLMKCPLELEETTLAAIRLWRYSPKFQDGEPIHQMAVATLYFELRVRRFDGRIGITVDSKGNLHDFDGDPVSRAMLQSSNSIIVTCGPSIAFSVLEKALKDLENQGIRNFLLSSWSYAFKPGRLFYRFLCGAAKSSNTDEDIQPPKLEIDVTHLATLAKASGSPAFLPLSSPVTYLSYVIYVSERGEIIEVERTGGPIVTNVEEELRHAHVLQPGQRGNAPVPATISVFIPIK